MEGGGKAAAAEGAFGGHAAQGGDETVAEAEGAAALALDAVGC